MPIHLELIENGWILLFQVERTWTTDEILTAKAETRHIFETAQHPIHALVDLHQATVNVALLQASHQVIGGDPLPNPGQIAVVGVSRMMRLIAAPILALAGGSETLTFLDGLDEAKHYLRRYITAPS